MHFLTGRDIFRSGGQETADSAREQYDKIWPIVKARIAKDEADRKRLVAENRNVKRVRLAEQQEREEGPVWQSNRNVRGSVWQKRRSVRVRGSVW